MNLNIWKGLQQKKREGKHKENSNDEKQVKIKMKMNEPHTTFHTTQSMNDAVKTTTKKHHVAKSQMGMDTIFK